jgi:2-dehydro-3-deoxygalactonokinase
LTSQTQWVAVDWGTSNVRVWGVAGDGATTFTATSDKGMSRIGREDYPLVLAELIAGRADDHAETLICGMAGARQGWMEAAYVDVPANLNALARHAVSPADGIRILPGVRQRERGHEDVMRGEETQLLGLLALQPGFEGVAILPGTHSKWAELRGGQITRFVTAMTGELYEVIAEHTVLRHALDGERVGPATEDGIDTGLNAGLARPERLTELLFRVRAAALVSERSADWCWGYLSGLLVGAEVAGHRDWMGAVPVPIVGSPRLGRLYAAALAKLDIPSHFVDAADATIAGLMRARAQT